MQTFKVSYLRLHEKIEAFRILFERNPKIHALGTFDDITDVTVFGPVLVISVGKDKFVFEADGAEWVGLIEKVAWFELS